MNYFYAYILKSIKDGKHYYGSCSDMDLRLKKHNNGEVKSTKSRRPLVLHYSEKYPSRSDAQKREYFFKSINGYLWLKENSII